MCGIVGYLGAENAYPIIIKGLKRLEYRGYDSAGVALYNGQLSLFKTKGKVADLEQKAAGETLPEGSLGIGHTRWATHGVPNEVNAHPHSSNSGRLVLVHNGIIENYESLRTSLVQRGYTFHSETDTEVLVNLIEEVQRKEKVKLGMAVQIALNQVIGAYAIAVFDTERPTEVVVAKLGSPLAIGIGKDAYYIGSDASPFIEYTNRTIYLEDNETAVLNLAKGLKIFKISDNSKVTPHIQELQLSLEHIEKAGFDHFMLKEIFEQPRAITDTFRGRLLPDSESLKIGGMEDHLARFEAAGKITIIACGTSWHAGLVGEYLFEDLARIPVEVEYASEFR
ncbi:MAG: isomerizing glutamine--fructose-6-phosphate transaminase, partial [Lutibacter sp.]|nr:isomerizing glutamine--fructose-6-phosphate transaminase [Lutibacter sp.]